MTQALDELRDSLVRLHEGGVGVGLASSEAATLVRALGEGVSVAQAAGLSGLDPRVAAVAERGAVSDLPALLGPLVGVVADHDAGARELRSAGTYPLILAASIALAAVVVGSAVPRLAALPGEHSVELVGLLGWLAAVPAALLLALGACVLGRVRLPWLSTGWPQLEGAAFVRALDALCRTGAPLPQALRAASLLGGPRAREAAEELARSLEAGAPTDRAQPLFDPFEATLLTAAAAHGTLLDATGALAEQRVIALRRAIPDTIVRIHAAALLLAGGAVLAVGLTFFSVYGRVLAS